MDTTAYGSEVHKELYLFTNDSGASEITIPVDVNIKRRFRFITQSSVHQSTGSLDASITNLTIHHGERHIVEYLEFYGPSVKPLGWTVQPAGFHVSESPFHGKVKVGDGEQTIDGYRFLITIPKDFKNQRVPVTLNLSTNDSVFGAINNTIYLQNGIVCDPSPVFLGPVGQSFRPFSVQVSWPAHQFRILSASINLPQFSVRTSGNGLGSSHTITIRYLRKPGFGPIQATLTLRTNSPSQPIIKVPVSGRFAD